MQGEDAQWGLTEHLAAAQLDTLNTLAWMQSEDGAKNRNRPSPVRRPGVEPDEKVYGSASVEIDEMSDWLRSRNPAQHSISGGADV